MKFLNAWFRDDSHDWRRRVCARSVEDILEDLVTLSTEQNDKLDTLDASTRTQVATILGSIGGGGGPAENMVLSQVYKAVESQVLKAEEKRTSALGSIGEATRTLTALTGPVGEQPLRMATEAHLEMIGQIGKFKDGERDFNRALDMLTGVQNVLRGRPAGVPWDDIRARNQEALDLLVADRLDFMAQRNTARGQVASGFNILIDRVTTQMETRRDEIRAASRNKTAPDIVAIKQQEAQWAELSQVQASLSNRLEEFVGHQETWHGLLDTQQTDASGNPTTEETERLALMAKAETLGTLAHGLDESSQGAFTGLRRRYDMGAVVERVDTLDERAQGVADRRKMRDGLFAPTDVLAKASVKNVKNQQKLIEKKREQQAEQEVALSKFRSQLVAEKTELEKHSEDSYFGRRARRKVQKNINALEEKIEEVETAIAKLYNQILENEKEAEKMSMAGDIEPGIKEDKKGPLLGIGESDSEKKVRESGNQRKIIKDYYDKQRKKADEANAAYKASLANIRERVGYDSLLGRDSDVRVNRLMKKTGSDVGAIMRMLESHEKQAAGYSQAWDLMANEFIEQYNDLGTLKGREDKVEDFVRILADMTVSVKDANESIEVFDNWINGYDKQKSKLDSTFLGLGVNFEVNMVSFYDIWQAVKISLDAMEKKWKRNSDRAVAGIGQSVFGDRTNRFAAEFSRLAEESETARVDEFKTRYREKEPWTMQRSMYDSKDQDEVRACIELLIEKGFMKWDDPRLWQTLQNLKGGISFEGTTMESPFSDIRRSVQDACESIWTSEVFRGWDQSMESKSKAARELHNGEFDGYEDDPTKPRERILADMLKNWKSGNIEDVDPAKYAGFLYRSFDNGKLNGVPDIRWYYIIQGVTLKNSFGQTLLPKDFFSNIAGEKMGVFPHLDFLMDKTSPKKDGWIVPKNTPGAHEKIWSAHDMNCWSEFMGDAGGSYNPLDPSTKIKLRKFFYQNVIQSSEASGRVSRMQRGSDGNVDHDDAGAFFASWNLDAVQTALTQRSEANSKYSPDFWRNFLVHGNDYFAEISDLIRTNNKEHGDAEFWKKDKERILKAAAGRLRIVLTVLQTIQGNFSAGTLRANIWSGDALEDTGEYGIASINTTRDQQFLPLMKRLMRLRNMSTEDQEKMEHALKYKGYNHISTEGETKDLLARNPEYKEVFEYSRDHLMKGNAAEVLFAGDDAIETLLLTTDWENSLSSSKGGDILNFPGRVERVLAA